MVIGKAFKENSILIILLYLFFLAISIFGIIAIFIYIDKIVLKSVLITLLSFFIIVLSYLPYYVYKSKKIPDNIIVYDSINEIITINGYKRKDIINVSDIVLVTVHNLGTKLLLADRIEDGKLCFYLNDGSKIKTVGIDNIYDVYYKIDEIVFIDKENKNVVKEQLIDKLDGWGSRKEYPSIVSVLVSLFIPLVGVYFVYNQQKFKELKNGKATGLMSVAVVISAIWVLAAVIILITL